jgi:CRISPR/Cas system Type II protein with McrA/HNH and RuvC-like nuclease domain
MNLLNKIQSFFGKQDLIDAIKKTIKLLENSEDSVWSSLTAVEIKEILQSELRKIENNQGFNKLELAVLFAVTSNVQETAVWNDWHTEYLEVADVIDKYTGR